MDFNSIHKTLGTKDNPKREHQQDIDVIELEQKSKVLVVHNDDFNTFDFVISSLIEICDHSKEQAEQCTWLIHFKGKCEVKSGDLDDLMPRHKKLLSRGLTSEIL